MIKGSIFLNCFQPVLSHNGIVLKIILTFEQQAEAVAEDRVIFLKLSLIEPSQTITARKPVFGICDKIKLKPVSLATETS